jgi:hypothetical protein
MSYLSYVDSFKIQVELAGPREARGIANIVLKIILCTLFQCFLELRIFPQTLLNRSFVVNDAFTMVVVVL